MKRNIFFIVFVFGTWSVAAAHKITVDVLYQDGVAYLECWMGSNEPASSAKLEVLDSEGNVIHSGQLDEEGFYEYRPTRADVLTFSVNAGLGHKGEAELDLREVDLPSPSGQSSSLADTGEISPPTPEPTRPDTIPYATETRGGSERPQIRSSHGGLTDGERIVLGIICLASLAAALLGYRNQKRIAAIEEKLGARDMDSR